MAQATDTGKLVLPVPGDLLGLGAERPPVHHNLCTGRVEWFRLLKQMSGHSECLICLGVKQRWPPCTNISAQEG